MQQINVILPVAGADYVGPLQAELQGYVDFAVSVLKFGFADAVFKMGDQRAISAFTKRSNEAGLRSFLAGIEAPRSARRFATAGSSREARAGAKPRLSRRDLRRRPRDPVQEGQGRRGFAAIARDHGL
jgi:hypothetical protein